MKICILTENYYRGGLDTFIINLINSWPDLNDELTLVCNGSHAGLDFIKIRTKKSLKIHRYYRLFTSRLSQGHSSIKLGRTLPIRAFFVIAFWLLEYPILLPWYILTFVFYFRRNYFDRLLVVNGGYPASLLGRSAVIAWRLAGKQPLAVFNFHNSTCRPPWHLHLIENMIDRQIIKSTSHIVSVSNNCLNSLFTRNAFLDCSNLSFIYNGIEDPILRLQDNLEITNRINNQKYCLMLATYEPRKGHSFLLQAFKLVINNHPDIQLKIYGHGRDHEKFNVFKEVKRLNLENYVLLEDFTENSAELISGAALLVVPSQEYESFGLTIIEAMALSRPVVATNVGGIPEVLCDTNAGYVCAKDDPQEFANSMLKILTDDTLASQLGSNGRRAFESKFQSSNMAYNYKKLLS